MIHQSTKSQSILCFLCFPIQRQQIILYPTPMNSFTKARSTSSATTALTIPAIVGQRVSAICEDWSQHYDGVVTKVNPDGTYNITFDDNEKKRNIPFSRIRQPIIQGETKSYKGKGKTWEPNTDSSALTNLKRAADYVVQESYEAETQGKTLRPNTVKNKNHCIQI